MTERRQFCVHGHDTFLEGRDSAYRCLKCKREAGAAAREARRAEERAARSAYQVELNEAARRWDAEKRRRREKLARG
jgi:hypothetical protein